MSEAERIEKESFEFIASKLTVPFPEVEVVKRVVHTTADFGLVDLMAFTNGAVTEGVKAIKGGRDVITDVKMVVAGINARSLEKFGGRVHCHISDEEVKALAGREGITRARAAFRLHKAELEGKIVAIGNAPTALFELCDAIRHGLKPALVVGVPVGFVGAKESKEELLKLPVSSIVVRGNRGGSTIAVAIVNALIKLAEKDG